MLPKAHLTLHSRMSGSRWVITPLWLSGSWSSFLYSSSVYSRHLFLISSVLLGPYYFCPLLCPSFHEMFPWYLFPFQLFSSVSLHWSLRKAFFSPLAILWNSAFRWIYPSFSPLPSFLFFSQLFVRLPQTTILPFCISFSWGWSWTLPPVQCNEPPSIVH